MAALSEYGVQVFARAPVAGSVKKRLIPLLGADGAATLHQCLVEHSLGIARESGLGRVELWCTPDTNGHFFESCGKRFGASLHRQCTGDLGARMLNAIEDGLGRARHVLLIGSDCPSLSAADLRTSARALREGSDAVFCPAEDGGYMLVGMSHAMRTLFEAMTWGTGTVMEETRQRLRDLGRRWHELPPHWDVDRPEDYQRLLREGWPSAVKVADER